MNLARHCKKARKEKSKLDRAFNDSMHLYAAADLDVRIMKKPHILVSMPSDFYPILLLLIWYIDLYQLCQDYR